MSCAGGRVLVAWAGSTFEEHPGPAAGGLGVVARVLPELSRPYPPETSTSGIETAETSGVG